MLTHLLADNRYALCLTPGFFRFYAEIGILEALQEANCLNPSHVTGSSAGALVGAFVAAGSKPQTMSQQVLAIQRTDVWDVGGIGGLLKGELFQKLIDEFLPVKTFEECPVPCVFTAFDLSRMKTNFISSGSLALAVRASCTFPGLFQPAMIDGRPHIDGGVWDHVGLLGLEHCFNLDLERRRKTSTDSTDTLGQEDFTNKLVVNVVFSTPSGSALPKNLQKCRLLTIVVENIPMVTPFTMNTAGPLAYKLSRAAMRQALHSAHIQEHAPNHWVCYVDGALVKSEELDRPSPFPIQIPIERQISVASEMTDANANLGEAAVIPRSTSVQTLPITIEDNLTEDSPRDPSQSTSTVRSQSEASAKDPNSTTTTTENEHSTVTMQLAEDPHHVMTVDHTRVHVTTSTITTSNTNHTTTTTTSSTLLETVPPEDENILETMIEELYEQDDISFASLPSDEMERINTTHEGEPSLSTTTSNNTTTINNSKTANPTQESVAIPQPSESKQSSSAAAVLTHVPFTSTSSSSNQINESSTTSSTELKSETTTTRDDRSSSFTTNNLPDFIRIPSFSFINGTYYLYQKVSTTINSGMTSASQTSNQLINAVTSTFSTSFTATSTSKEGEEATVSLTTHKEEVVGEKRVRAEEPDSNENEEEEEEAVLDSSEMQVEEDHKKVEVVEKGSNKQKRRKTKAN